LSLRPWSTCQVRSWLSTVVPRSWPCWEKYLACQYKFWHSKTKNWECQFFSWHLIAILNKSWSLSRLVLTVETSLRYKRFRKMIAKRKRLGLATENSRESIFQTRLPKIKRSRDSPLDAGHDCGSVVEPLSETILVSFFFIIWLSLNQDSFQGFSQ
jgi:hypothetical protein